MRVATRRAIIGSGDAALVPAVGRVRRRRRRRRRRRGSWLRCWFWRRLRSWMRARVRSRLRSWLWSRQSHATRVHADVLRVPRARALDLHGVTLLCAAMVAHVAAILAIAHT